jgi:hypothetical protein
MVLVLELEAVPEESAAVDVLEVALVEDFENFNIIQKL